MKKERGIKNWFKERFSVMISLLLISCCLIPATFSKYTQKITQHINLSVIQAIGYFTAYDGKQVSSVIQTGMPLLLRHSHVIQLLPNLKY